MVILFVTLCRTSLRLKHGLVREGKDSSMKWYGPGGETLLRLSACSCDVFAGLSNNKESRARSTSRSDWRRKSAPKIGLETSAVVTGHLRLAWRHQQW